MKTRVLGAFLVLTLASVGVRTQSKHLDIYWIDVEGGAATLLVSPSGESLLYDSGWEVDGRDARRIASAVQMAGLKRIDYLVLSHYHADHAGGLVALAKAVPIGRCFDRGDFIEPANQRWRDAYLSVCANKRTILHAGDTIPLKGLHVEIVASNGSLIPIRGTAINPACMNAVNHLPDVPENQLMVGAMFTYGKFRFVDLADLDWQKEVELVCPVNRLGEVSIWQAGRHGALDGAGAPALLESIKPRVIVVNNGPRKGLGSASPGAQKAASIHYDRLAKSPGVEGIWQGHKSLLDPDHNTADDMIANVEDSADCKGNWIKASVAPDGSFTITNGRNQFSRTYQAARVEDVTLVAPGGIQAAIQQLIPGFERATGYKVKPTFGSGLGTKKQVTDGVPFDVPIVQPPYPEVVASGNVIANSETPLARVAVGVAVRTGDRKPDISTPEKVKALLLSVTSFSYPDPAGGAAAGVGFTKTLQDMGIYDQVKPKIHLSRGGATASIAKHEVEIGLTFYSEILTEKGVDAVGMLPESISPRTSLVAFIGTKTSHPDAARALIKYLSSPEAAATYRKVGMEPFDSAQGKAATPKPAAPKPTPPNTARLYVLDCGMLNIDPEGVARYHVTQAEVVESRMPVPCFLVVHPKGTLLWDVGVIPDADVEKAAPKPALYDVNPVSHAVVSKTLKSQLAALGYAPSDLTYVAVSHAHKDHTANLNQFASSTWLVRPAEREFMFKPGNERVEPKFFTLLERAKTTVMNKDEYDVFGDGTVMIKAAPGHTPAHEVMVLNLAKSGRIMVAGDLYHYSPERTFRRRPPDNEFNVEQSAASRAMIEEYLKKTGAAIWIEHDYRANAKLKKSPAYYE